MCWVRIVWLRLINSIYPSWLIRFNCMQIMEAPTNHQLTNMQRKINNSMICWRMGKTSRKAKTPLGDFKVTTPKNLLINNQAVTSIKNFTTTLAYPKISTYSWTFALIPNWTWSCRRANIVASHKEKINLLVSISMCDGP